MRKVSLTRGAKCAVVGTSRRQDQITVGSARHLICVIFILAVDLAEANGTNFEAAAVTSCRSSRGFTASSSARRKTPGARREMHPPGPGRPELQRQCPQAVTWRAGSGDGGPASCPLEQARPSTTRSVRRELLSAPRLPKHSLQARPTKTPEWRPAPGSARHARRAPGSWAARSPQWPQGRLKSPRCGRRALPCRATDGSRRPRPGRRNKAGPARVVCPSCSSGTPVWAGGPPAHDKRQRGHRFDPVASARPRGGRPPWRRIRG